MSKKKIFQIHFPMNKQLFRINFLISYIFFISQLTIIHNETISGVNASYPNALQLRNNNLFIANSEGMFFCNQDLIVSEEHEYYSKTISNFENIKNKILIAQFNEDGNVICLVEDVVYFFDEQGLFVRMGNLPNEIRESTYLNLIAYKKDSNDNFHFIVAFMDESHLNIFMYHYIISENIYQIVYNNTYSPFYFDYPNIGINSKYFTCQILSSIERNYVLTCAFLTYDNDLIIVQSFDIENNLAEIEEYYAKTPVDGLNMITSTTSPDKQNMLVCYSPLNNFGYCFTYNFDDNEISNNKVYSEKCSNVYSKYKVYYFQEEGIYSFICEFNDRFIIILFNNEFTKLNPDDLTTFNFEISEFYNFNSLSLFYDTNEHKLALLADPRDINNQESLTDKYIITTDFIDGSFPSGFSKPTDFIESLEEKDLSLKETNRFFIYAYDYVMSVYSNISNKIVIDFMSEENMLVRTKENKTINPSLYSYYITINNDKGRLTAEIDGEERELGPTSYVSNITHLNYYANFGNESYSYSFIFVLYLKNKTLASRSAQYKINVCKQNCSCEDNSLYCSSCLDNYIAYKVQGNCIREGELLSIVYDENSKIYLDCYYLCKTCSKKGWYTEDMGCTSCFEESGDYLEEGTQKCITKQCDYLYYKDKYTGMKTCINGSSCPSEYPIINYERNECERDPTEDNNTNKPSSSTNEPTFLTNEPTFLTNAPTFLTNAPTFLTNAPTFLTNEPTFLTNEPTFLTNEPTILTNEPTFFTNEPTSSSSNQSSSSTNQPPSSSSNQPPPSSSNNQPTASTNQPSSSSSNTNNPSSSTTQPSASSTTLPSSSSTSSPSSSQTTKIETSDTIKSITGEISYEKVMNLINELVGEENVDQIEKTYSVLSDSMKNIDVSSFKEDITITGTNITYQITTSESQKNSDHNSKVSIIDLGECEKIIKRKISYEDDPTPLLILKIDVKKGETKSTAVEYEVYNPYTKEKIDLEICSNTSIAIYAPITLNNKENSLYNELSEQGYDLFDANNSFYIDPCAPYTSTNGTDVSLRDRKDYYYNEDIVLCEDSCKYVNVSTQTEKVYCQCKVKSSVNTDSDQEFSPQKLVESFYKVDTISNFEVLYCYKLVFNKNSLKKNICFYIMLVLLALFLTSMIINLFSAMKKIDEIIFKIFQDRFMFYFLQKIIVEGRKKRNGKVDNELIDVNNRNGKKLTWLERLKLARNKRINESSPIGGDSSNILPNKNLYHVNEKSKKKEKKKKKGKKSLNNSLIITSIKKDFNNNNEKLGLKEKKLRKSIKNRNIENNETNIDNSDINNNENKNNENKNDENKNDENKNNNNENIKNENNNINNENKIHDKIHHNKKKSTKSIILDKSNKDISNIPNIPNIPNINNNHNNHNNPNEKNNVNNININIINNIMNKHCPPLKKRNTVENETNCEDKPQNLGEPIKKPKKKKPRLSKKRSKNDFPNSSVSNSTSVISLKKSSILKKHKKKKPLFSLGEPIIGEKSIKNQEKKKHKKEKEKENDSNINSTKQSSKNIKYIDEELNRMSYEEALEHDKRNYWTYYWSLLKKKHIIVLTFVSNDDYNVFTLKFSLFILSLALYFSINTLFYKDSTMHQIFTEKGKYNLLYQIPQVLYSTLISFLMTYILKKLSLSQNELIKIKKELDQTKSRQLADQAKKCLQIKLITFFLIGLSILLFFWYYLSAFAAVYPNTQIHLIKDTLLSFGISMSYPFVINLIPGLFRIYALKSEQKDRECLFKTGQIISLL